jgi:hypothetical protein
LKFAKQLDLDAFRAQLKENGQEMLRLRKAYRETLHEIIKKYPTTQAAEEASKLLER